MADSNQTPPSTGAEPSSGYTQHEDLLANHRRLERKEEERSKLYLALVFLFLVCALLSPGPESPLLKDLPHPMAEALQGRSDLLPVLALITFGAFLNSQRRLRQYERTHRDRETVFHERNLDGNPEWARRVIELGKVRQEEGAEQPWLPFLKGWKL
jgi:hypothetical protein